MENVDKDSLSIILTLFAGILQESNLFVGIIVNKKNPDESRLVFVNAEQAKAGNFKGAATVRVEELNKWVTENGNPD